MAESQSRSSAGSTLEDRTKRSLNGIRIVRTADKVIFKADATELKRMLTPKDNVVPEPVALISQLYAESLRDLATAANDGAPVFCGGMAVLAGLPVYQAPFKVALQALQGIFAVAKRRGIGPVDERAFACWQSVCLRTFEKRSVSMLVVDAGAGSDDDRELLRKYGYDCPDHQEP